MRKLARREFVRRFSVGALASAGTVGSMIRGASESGEVAVCIFSKHLQWLSYDRMGETAAALGFDGVELTVRPGGHVEPNRAAEDLPRAVAAVRRAGLSVPSITTNVTEADEASRKLLSIAAELGVRFYRLGYYTYTERETLDQTLDRARRSLEGLARLNAELGICGDYQNHAGEGYFGAAIWDLWLAQRDLDPRWVGSQFDLRHATLEGAQTWPVDFRRVADRVHTVVAKDFRWEGGEPVDCPLGQGIADFRRFFPMLTSRSFRGPVILHLEYPLGGADQGQRELSIPSDQVLAAMRRDRTMLVDLLGSAGLRPGGR